MSMQVVACCGYWDHSIRCYAAEDGRLLQAARAHKDVVTCLALGADGCTLVSGAPGRSSGMKGCPSLGAWNPRYAYILS